MAEKGLPATPLGLYPYQPTGLPNITAGDNRVYVIFNKIMLSLQNVYGVSASRNSVLMSGVRVIKA